MKKIIMLVIIGVNILIGSSFDDGMNAYNNGNKQKAINLFGKACDGGFIDGCYNLGIMYDNGDGVRQDKRKAKELFGKACDGGDMGGCKGYKILNEAGI